MVIYIFQKFQVFFFFVRLCSVISTSISGFIFINVIGMFHVHTE